MGIDRDAVTSNTWPWVKRHEPKGLRCCSSNNFPYINTQEVGDNGQFIDHTDIDSAEHILQKLDKFCCTSRADRNDSINHRFVQCRSQLQASRYDASDNFRCIAQAK